MNKNQRTLLYNLQGGVCAVCGRYMERPQFAHAIANTKANRKKYGSKIIDSPFNGALVCSLACNDRVNIGFNPMECERKMKEIREKEERFKYF